MTLERLCAAVYADLNLNAVPSTATLARIRRYVNEGIRAVFREPGLERLADSDQPWIVTTVPGEARYVVPNAVARIHRIFESTNDLALEAMPRDRYRRVAPDAASHRGTPTHYVPIGRVAVERQPIPPSTLFAWSTDNLYDKTRTVYVEGIIASGVRDTAEATLNGSLGVPLTSNFGINTHIFETVEDFYVSAPGLGIVILTAGVPAPGGEVPGSGNGVQLGSVGSTTLRPRYTGFYLWPTPSAAVTYYVDYRRELLDLVNDSDEPPLPTDFHPLIAAYARMREYEKADDDRYAIARAEYERALGRLKFATQWSSDELPVLGRAGRVGYSRLGSQYPADSWR